MESPSRSRDLYERWTGLTTEEKRQVIENVVEKVTIDQDSVTIDRCYLPSSTKMVTEGQRNLIPALPFCHATSARVPNTVRTRKSLQR